MGFEGLIRTSSTPFTDREPALESALESALTLPAMETTMNHDPDRDRRRRYRAFCQEHARVAAEWRERGYQYPPPVYPVLPPDLAGLACGARTKSSGRPCRSRAIYANGRCKHHGGCSTGPRTAEGKAKSSLNGNAPKKKRTS